MICGSQYKSEKKEKDTMSLISSCRSLIIIIVFLFQYFVLIYFLRISLVFLDNSRNWKVSFSLFLGILRKWGSCSITRAIFFLIWLFNQKENLWILYKRKFHTYSIIPVGTVRYGMFYHNSLLYFKYMSNMLMDVFITINLECNLLVLFFLFALPK